MIKALVMDVDGTLTDGKIYISNSGEEIKAFDIKDGMGIKIAQQKHIAIAIVTGRKSEIVMKRASELEIKYVYQGINDKLEVLNSFINEIGVSAKEVAYIGDDINDLCCMQICGLSGCPCDSADEVLKKASFVSKKHGGSGAVREFINYILSDINEKN